MEIPPGLVLQQLDCNSSHSNQHYGPKNENNNGPKQELHYGPKNENNDGPKQELHYGPKNENNDGPKKELHYGPKISIYAFKEFRLKVIKLCLQTLSEIYNQMQLAGLNRYQILL